MRQKKIVLFQYSFIHSRSTHVYSCVMGYVIMLRVSLLFVLYSAQMLRLSFLYNMYLLHLIYCTTYTIYNYVIYINWYFKQSKATLTSGFIKFKIIHFYMLSLQIIRRFNVVQFCFRGFILSSFTYVCDSHRLLHNQFTVKYIITFVYCYKCSIRSQKSWFCTVYSFFNELQCENKLKCNLNVISCFVTFWLCFFINTKS